MEFIGLIIVAIAVCLLVIFYPFKIKQVEEPDKRSDWGGAFHAFGKVSRQLIANPGPAVVVIVARLILTLIEVNTIGLGSGPEYSGLGYFVKLMAFEAPFILLFLLAGPTYGLALADRKHLSIRDFLRFDARKYFAIVVAGILYALAAFGSLLLLLIPAIWVIAWFALYTMVIVDKKMGPVKALKESHRLMRNNKGKFWGLMGAFILLAIPVSLTQWIPVIGVPFSSVASQLIAIFSSAAMGLLYRWAQTATKKSTKAPR